MLSIPRFLPFQAPGRTRVRSDMHISGSTSDVRSSEDLATHDKNPLFSHCARHKRKRKAAQVICPPSQTVLDGYSGTVGTVENERAPVTHDAFSSV